LVLLPRGYVGAAYVLKIHNTTEVLATAVLATEVLATGVLALGRNVSLYLIFWGGVVGKTYLFRHLGGGNRRHKKGVRGNG
jgi:hypothetical protein